MSTAEFLLEAWQWTVPAVVVIAAGVVLLGVQIAKKRSGRNISLAVGILVLLVVSTVSPLAVLASGFLFTAHMIQHLLLLLIIPLLLVILLRGSRGSRRWQRFSIILGWSAGVGAMWLWHEPNLCSLSVTSPAMQATQIATLLAGGYLFWRPVWGARETQLQPGGAVAYLTSACLACTLLGIYIAFVPLTVCPVFASASTANPVFQLVSDRWAISAAADQQLGGLMMWVPACSIYLGAILAQVGRWYGSEVMHPSRAN